MAVYTMGNTQVFIGTTTVASDLTDYQADTYQEISEVQSISALVDMQNFAQFTALDDARERNFKTTKSAENITLSCGFDPDDAGQSAVRTAAADTDQVNYNFKVEYNDDGSSNPTTVYFSGQVGNDPYPGGAAEDISIVEYTIVNNTGFTVEFRA